MRNLKTSSGFILFTVIVLILYHSVSSCKIQSSEKINKDVGKKKQENEMKIQEKEKIGEPFDIWVKFVASGWMGDGGEGTRYVKLFEAWRENTHSDPVCIKIVYLLGPKGWAGIYWQNKPNSWGDKPGTNLQKMGYKKLTFWARGENGGEVVEFKAGGINVPGKPYKDSFEVSSGKIVLENTWKQYTLDLEGKDLSSVIGGFCWVASRAANPEGLTFYLDDIYYTF